MLQYQSAESECNDFNIFMIIMLGIDKSVTQLVGKEHAHHIDGKKLLDTQPDCKGDNLSESRAARSNRFTRGGDNC